MKPKERRLFYERYKNYEQAVKRDSESVHRIRGVPVSDTEAGLTVNKVALKDCISLSVLETIIDARSFEKQLACLEGNLPSA